MKFIAHRGLLEGSNKLVENTTFQILKAINLSYDVEVDVRLHESSLYLGHDSIQEKVSLDFLDIYKNFLWIHAKDLETLTYLYENNDKLNLFCHNEDEATFTSKGYIWTHLRNSIYMKKSIALKFEYEFEFIQKIKNVAGICTDYPILYKEAFKSKALF